MKLLITGGGGFVGRNLCEYLKDNSSNITKIITTLNIGEASNNRLDEFDKEIEFVKCDLTNKKDVDDLFKKEFDTIIHCAAVSTGAKDIINRPYLHVTDNAIMGSLVFRRAFQNEIDKVIFLSCSAIYDSSETLIKEEAQNAYKINKKYFGGGWTKVYLEKQCEFYSKLGKTKFIVIRHSNMFGKNDDFNDDRSHMVAANLKKVFLGKENDTVIVWGSGKTKRDILYIDDLSSFIKIILENSFENNYSIFNLGAATGISVKEVVQKIISVSGKKLNIEFDTSKPDIDVNIFLDCSKAKSLGWSPKYSFENGVELTFKWMKDNINKLS